MVGEPEPGLLLQRLPLPRGEHKLRALALLAAHQVSDQAVPLMLRKLQVLINVSIILMSVLRFVNILFT